MILNIAEFKETIEINRADMTGNRMLTNEIVVDELMLALGYNKRKDKTVKRLYNSLIDWEIIDGSIKLAVKVISLGEESVEDEINQVQSLCADKRISILIITNGETVTVYRFNKETLQYTKVIELTLTEELNDAQKEVVSAISKDSYNLEVIDKMLETPKITTDSIVDYLNNNVSEFKCNVSSWLNAATEDIEDACNNLLDILNNRQVTDVKEEINTEELDELNSKLENALGEVESYKGLLNESNNKIDELNKKLEEAQILIDELKNSNSSDNKSNDNILDDYINQITELSNKYSDAMAEVDRLNVEIKEYEAKIADLSGANRQKAIDLLNVIEDSPELERNYVAVINSQLMQFDKLHTFVGRLLQKLYEIKSLEASQYIFNADLFKLINPGVRNDLIMNNKAYDIDLGNASEDEVLNKLRVLFSQFEDLVFECKKVGTLNSTNAIEKFEDNTDEENEVTVTSGVNLSKDDSFTQGFNESQGDWESSNNTEFSVDNTFGDSSNIEIEDDIFGDRDDVFGENVNTYSNEELFEEDIVDEPNNTNYLLVQNLVNIDSLVWTEENVRFNNIKYIGTQEVTFAINMDMSESTFDNLLAKCIDAVLALELYNGNSNIITELKQKDFSYINNSIRLFTDEYRNYPRINGTRYAIVDVASVQQAATILLDICNELNIATNNKYIYFDVNTESKFIIDNYGYSEDSVQLRETEYFSPSETDVSAYAIIKGDMFNNILVTKNSLKAHENIIENTEAVRTKYLQQIVTSIADVQDIIGKIVEEAFNDDININYNMIGNILGDEYKIVSDDENEVTPNNISKMIGGQPIYISEMQGWQVPHALVKVHTTLFNNTAIALKTKVNVSAVNYYGSEFETTEPSLSLAIRSFVNYITLCVKNNK